MSVNRCFPVLLFVIALSLFSCKVKKQAEAVPPPPPPPNWVSERPTSSAYYVGVGIAGKVSAGSNYMQIAKENALNDLASEIKVNVSGNSILYTMENETGFKEDFLSTTKLSSSVNLEGFEQSGVYETPDSYYVYYKLSKAKYKALRDAKISTAISLSKQSRVEGKQQAINGNYAQAMQNYYQALASLEEYINEPLKAEIDGKEQYYGNILLQEMQQLVNELTIEPVIQEFTITQGNVVPDNKTVFIIKDKMGKVQSGVQVLFSMGEEVLLKENAISDHTGKVNSSAGKIKITGRNILKAKLIADLDSKKHKVIERVMENIQWPSSAMIIMVEAPRVFLKVDQMKNAEKVSNVQVIQAFSSAAISNSFMTTVKQNEANLIAKIVLNSKESGVYQDLYSVTFSGYLSFQDAKTNTEVFRESFDGIKGVDLNYDRAYNKGLETFKKRLIYETIPRFRRKHLD